MFRKERVRSKLTLRKVGVELKLSEDRLDFRYLICVERDVLLRISNHTIIDLLAKMNAEMRSMLFYK